MADVAATLNAWSTTESSNSPAGSANIGAGLDDNLRVIQAVVRQGDSSNTIASAATTDLSTINERYVTISGTATITAFGTLTAGMYKVGIFSGIATVTHNGTSLICPAARNIKTEAGMAMGLLSLGSGNWRVLWVSTASAGVYTAIFTRDISLTSTQNISIPFRPQAVRFDAVAGGQLGASWGTQSEIDGANCVYDDSATSPGTYSSTSAAIFLQPATAGTYSSAVVSTWATTTVLTWTNAGSPVGTASIVLTAYRGAN